MTTYGKSNIRFDVDVGCFSLKCSECLEWWPLDIEFWQPTRMTKCRACIRSWDRERKKGGTSRQEYNRLWRARNAERLREYARTHYRAMDKQKKSEANRRYYLRHRERLLEYQRQYDAENRDVIRMKRRLVQERAA